MRPVLCMGHFKRIKQVPRYCCHRQRRGTCLTSGAYQVRIAYKYYTFFKKGLNAMRERVLAVCNGVDPSIDFEAGNLITGEVLDSVTLVEIVSELMEEFDIDIPYEDIVPENFDSIDAMVDVVEKYV